MNFTYTMGMIANNIFKQSRGARPDVANVAVIMAAGNDPTVSQAWIDAAHQQGINIFALGIGPITDFQVYNIFIL